MGGTFRNSEGNIVHIYADRLGITRNNEVALWGLQQWLKNSMKLNHNQLIIEGDSLVNISILKKVQFGTQLSKIYGYWRIETHVNVVSSLLKCIHDPLLSHIRRSRNKLVDHLANHTLENETPYQEELWPQDIHDILWIPCIYLSLQAISPIMGVSTGQNSCS